MKSLFDVRTTFDLLSPSLSSLSACYTAHPHANTPLLALAPTSTSSLRSLPLLQLKILTIQSDPPVPHCNSRESIERANGLEGLKQLRVNSYGLVVECEGAVHVDVTTVELGSREGKAKLLLL